MHTTCRERVKLRIATKKLRFFPVIHSYSLRIECDKTVFFFGRCCFQFSVNLCSYRVSVCYMVHINYCRLVVDFLHRAIFIWPVKHLYIRSECICTQQGRWNMSFFGTFELSARPSSVLSLGTSDTDSIWENMHAKCNLLLWIMCIVHMSVYVI